MNENFYQHQSVRRHDQPKVGRRNKSIYYEVYIKSMIFFIENKRNSLIIKRFVLFSIAANTSPHFFSEASKVSTSSPGLFLREKPWGRGCQSLPPLPTRGETTLFPGFSLTGRENLGTRLGGLGEAGEGEISRSWEYKHFSPFHSSLT